MPEEFRVVVTNLADWMANSSPPWAADRVLMACRLVPLNKRPGVDMTRRAIPKLVMRSSRDQAKTSCGSLQLCAGIEARIEVSNHAVAKRKRERTAPEPEERAEEYLDEGSMAGEANKVRGRIVAAVEGMGEVLAPQGVRQAAGEGEGGASDYLRTAMEAIDWENSRWTKNWRKQRNMTRRQRRGGMGGGSWHWKPQGS